MFVRHLRWCVCKLVVNDTKRRRFVLRLHGRQLVVSASMNVNTSQSCPSQFEHRYRLRLPQSAALEEEQLADSYIRPADGSGRHIAMLRIPPSKDEFLAIRIQAPFESLAVCLGVLAPRTSSILEQLAVLHVWHCKHVCAHQQIWRALAQSL